MKRRIAYNQGKLGLHYSRFAIFQQAKITFAIMKTMEQKLCDLALEGGGVKGIGIAGAIEELFEAGFHFRRIAGTSAGALVGALLAAGYTSPEIRQLLMTIDYTRFRDPTLLSHFGPPGKALSVVFHKGVYKGRYLYKWLEEKLAAKNIRTFGDIRITDNWCNSAPLEQRYKLVVLTADVTRGKLIRLPWDYHEYGLIADNQPIAAAVRASISIPFYYKPARLRPHHNLFVDGGIISNFPLDLFNSTPDWPTIGIKLSAKPEASLEHLQPIRGPYSYARNIITTMLGGQDQIHLDDPSAIEKTIFVDTNAIKPTDFDITLKQQQLLFQNGQHAAHKFLTRRM